MYQKDNRIKVIFLGTPTVASLVLKTLLQKASHKIKVILVVTQPPARSSRGQQITPSPVHQTALEFGIPVLTPQKANEVEFLNDISAMEPDICLTAAYGNYLPSKFLSLPKFGTVNIHPSLLPKYRGAAPVQRTIENGDKVTGVSLLYSVKEMDAGPIIAQEMYELNSQIKSPELLDILFLLGTKLFIKSIPLITQAQPLITQQIHENATNAAKITAEESILDFNLSAEKIHNKVRAFSGWPSTKVTFLIDNKPLE
jgi:methionyl-tRNA formyltransferase